MALPFIKEECSSTCLSSNSPTVCDGSCTRPHNVATSSCSTLVVNKSAEDEASKFIKEECDLHNGEVKSEAETLPLEVTLSVLQSEPVHLPAKDVHSQEWKSTTDFYRRSSSVGKSLNCMSKENSVKESVRDRSPDALSCIDFCTKKYTCEDCGQGFSRKDNLKRHLVLHTGQKEFVCEVCGRRFARKEDVKQHNIVRHSGVGLPTFPCEICGKNFTQKAYLRQHLHIHSWQHPFTCEVCGRCFSSKSHLKRHSVSHMGQKLYVCQVCGKQLTRKTSLKQHLVLHTGEKAFSCEMCGKCFSLKATLKKHYMLHVGDRPFGCDVCGRRFSQKGNLKQHLILHTEPKQKVSLFRTGWGVRSACFSTNGTVGSETVSSIPISSSPPSRI